jgi:hypothetical protein
MGGSHPLQSLMGTQARKLGPEFLGAVRLAVAPA